MKHRDHDPVSVSEQQLTEQLQCLDQRLDGIDNKVGVIDNKLDVIHPPNETKLSEGKELAIKFLENPMGAFADRLRKASLWEAESAENRVLKFAYKKIRDFFNQAKAMGELPGAEAEPLQITHGEDDDLPEDEN
jgi:hypothetical protein